MVEDIRGYALRLLRGALYSFFIFALGVGEIWLGVFYKLLFYEDGETYSGW